MFAKRMEIFFDLNMETQRDMQQRTDEDLLASYQKADAAAFDEFFRRHKNLVYSYLLSRLRDRGEAEEAFQKTFMRVHRYILAYDGAQSALAWVMTIAKNVSSDVFSARRPTHTLDEVSESVSSFDPEGAIEARNTLLALVAGLPPKDQQLFERRILRDESFEQIACDEGWTVANTRQKVSRLVRRLRSTLLET